MAFSERLKAERLKKGLKQRELAEKIKSTNTSVSNWESGLSKPSASVVKLLADALEVSPFALLGDYTLKEIQELERKVPSELSYEDELALEFSKDIVKNIAVQAGDSFEIPEDDLHKNLADLSMEVQKAAKEKLMGGGAEQLLYSYHCLNSKGKVLLLDYLIGLLHVPAYVDDMETAGMLDKEQIEELKKIRDILAGGDNNGKHS